MGHFYPWASPWEIGRLKLSQLGMYLSRIPMLELRRHYGTAQLSWLVDQFMAGWRENKKPLWGSPEDALPWFAERRASKYSHREAQGLKLALQRGWIGQAEWDELEACGFGLDEYQRALASG